MRSYFRKSVDVGDNTRYIVRYTPSEYLLISVIKLIFFIFVVWPVQILWLIFTLPFRLIGKFYKSSLPIKVKVGVTIFVIIAALILYVFGAGKS